MNTSKRCHKCRKTKPNKDFWKDKSTYDGLCGRCKICNALYASKWRKLNITRFKALQSRYERVNKSKRREMYINWSRKNPDKKRKSRRLWNSNNPDKVADSKRKRRALKLGAKICDLTQEEWGFVKAMFRYRCAYCNSRCNLTQDHVIPLSKGGNHTISNIVPACFICNSRKQNMSVYEFVERESLF